MSHDPHSNPLPPRLDRRRGTPTLISTPGARTRSPLVPFRTLLLLAALMSLSVSVLGALVILVSVFAGGGVSSRAVSATSPATALPPVTGTVVAVVEAPTMPQPSTLTPNVFEIGVVIRDVSGNFAFPIAADPRQYVWTHTHWDGTNAADIEARFGVSRAEFTQLTSVQLVACTSGLVFEWSGDNGGLGYVLEGDDGLDYYYAHMSELWLPDGTRVQPGTVLGLMGNTGGTAQFIEPHLHFAIGPRGSLQSNTWLVINVAEWLLDTFGLGWEDRPAAEPPPAQPAGSPLPYDQVGVITSYAQALAQGLPQPAIELGYTSDSAAVPLEVVATLTGDVNVIRWTAQYGTRLQITNEASQTTVVISGVEEWFVRDGEIVTQGQIIGRWNPAQRPTLHYMLYVNSTIHDPTLTLNSH